MTKKDFHFIRWKVQYFEFFKLFGPNLKKHFFQFQKVCLYCRFSAADMFSSCDKLVCGDMLVAEH